MVEGDSSCTNLEELSTLAPVLGDVAALSEEVFGCSGFGEMVCCCWLKARDGESILSSITPGLSGKTPVFLKPAMILVGVKALR